MRKKKKAPPKKRGRPSKCTQEYLEQAERLSELGASDRELALFFRINEQTIEGWKAKNPSFLAAILRGQVAFREREAQERLSYTPDLGNRICQAILEGKTLRQIDLDPTLPSKSTILAWATSPDPIYSDFADQYARAREARVFGYVEELIEIADDASGDFHEVEIVEGVVGTQLNREAIDRAKLRIDTRKFLITKILPKFGEKLTQALELTDKGKEQLQPVIMWADKK